MTLPGDDKQRPLTCVAIAAGNKSRFEFALLCHIIGNLGADRSAKDVGGLRDPKNNAAAGEVIFLFQWPYSSPSSSSLPYLSNGDPRMLLGKKTTAQMYRYF